MLAVVCLAACAPKPAAAASEGSLVLEVGGEHPSLAGGLRALGVELVEPPAPPQPGPQPPQAPPRALDEPAPAPPPAPPAEEPAWFEVEIQTGQTIGALSQQYLGTSRRYREILELNHLTEAAARRLRPGSRIKIPKPTPR